MFERPHHQHIAKVLHAFNSDLLQEANCYFGGGTAIVLLLGEYRESLDIDFLCSSKEGYRLLRNTVSTNSLGALLKEPIKHLRDVRMERDRILTVLEVEDEPLKVKFLLEDNTSFEGEFDPNLRVPTLSRVDMYTQR